MEKTSIHKAALLGSASALGLNWIYDRNILKNHKDEGNSMIFEPIDHDLYKSVKNSFDVYPNHHVGDLDFMGEVYYLLYMFFNFEKEQHLNRFREVFYEYFREDYEYDGYIESYGKAFLEQYKNEQENNAEVKLHTDYEDKQLIGLIFILALFDYDESINKVQDALYYAKTLTSYDNVRPLSEMLFHLLTKLEVGINKRTALQDSITYAPTVYKKQLEMALTDIDIDTFITQYSGVACGIEQSLPLIYYIIAHTTSWKDALVLNATLGGASSARGIFISAIMSRFVDIPEEYQFKLNYKVR